MSFLKITQYEPCPGFKSKGQVLINTELIAYISYHDNYHLYSIAYTNWHIMVNKADAEKIFAKIGASL